MFLYATKRNPFVIENNASGTMTYRTNCEWLVNMNDGTVVKSDFQPLERSAVQ
jgi:hypothetical protein